MKSFSDSYVRHPSLTLPLSLLSSPPLTIHEWLVFLPFSFIQKFLRSLIFLLFRFFTLLCQAFFSLFLYLSLSLYLSLTLSLSLSLSSRESREWMHLNFFGKNFETKKFQSNTFCQVDQSNLEKLSKKIVFCF